MKRTEALNSIYQLIDRSLPSGSGFELRKTAQGFFKKIKDGSQMIRVAFWDYGSEYEFSLVVGVRHDDVEMIFHKFSGAPPKYHTHSNTLTNRWDRVVGPPSRFALSCATDLDSIETQFRYGMNEVILPFFDQHRSVNDLNVALNHTKEKIDITVNPSAAMHSVILAYMCHDPCFEGIVRGHHRDMQLEEIVCHPFNELVRFLRTGGAGLARSN